ncbi:MAG: caspase family protein, partial [Candidatus Marinimicrobia bacterium]|nr:caspase family protein [Candidatus Neomarinimicrobiota bacterium]
MKTGYYLSFLLILFFQEISFSQQKGMRIRLREGGDEIQIYDDSWALIIGINKYTNWPPLDYAVNDANSIRDLLINKFGFKTDHIFLLTDEDATLKKIKDTLSDLGEIVGKNDRVIIYFSGHGQSLDLENGGQMGFL